MRSFINYSVVFILFVTLFSCSENSTNWKKMGAEVKASKDIAIKRYERALFSINPDQLQEGLASISQEYYLFIGEEYKNPQALIQMRSYLQDTLIRQGYNFSEKVFPNLAPLPTELANAFERIRRFIPSFSNPEVYTYISGYDQQTSIYYNGEVMTIPLDLYLGDTTKVYQQLRIPLYMRQHMSKDYLLSDIVLTILHHLIPRDIAAAPLVDQMLYEGMILAMTDYILPDVPDYCKMGYTQVQEEWCRQNEEEIWKYLVGNRLLFSTNQKDIGLMMNDGPFTNGFPKESPARTGIWMGWQIARAWVNHNDDVPLNRIASLQNGKQLLEESRYKPQKK